MKANNDKAETVRRFPLSWQILDCTFQRIPLFSLAKSLADRKFIAVLHQTLKSFATPADAVSDDTEGSLGKRKRPGAGMSFELTALRSREGCLATGGAVMGALQTLLGRLDRILTPDDRMGSEHIRALFSQQASDVAVNLAPILTLCDAALTLDSDLAPSSREKWIDTMATLWDLRLRGSTDATEVATFLSRPAFLLLSKTTKGDFPSSHSAKTAWVRQLEGFLHRNLMLPAKSASYNRNDLETMERCLDMNASVASTTLPIFFHLAATTPPLLAGSYLSKSEDQWTKLTFYLAEQACRKIDVDDQVSVLTAILEEAIRIKSTVSVDDLRNICRRHALASSASDWYLLSLVARCDPDTFLLNQEGTKLLEDVSERLLGPVSDMTHAGEFLTSLARGYEDARDLTTFMRRWYTYLSQSDASSYATSVWFSSHLRQDGQLVTAIRKTVSTQQILDLLDWLEDQPVRHPAASLIFLDTIASSLSTEVGAEAFGLRLFSLSRMVTLSDVPSELRLLRWHIASRTICWVEPLQVEEVWNSTSPDLTCLLRNGSTNDAETFEGFRLASRIWESAYPNGTIEPKVAELLAVFSERLAADIKRMNATEADWDPRSLQDSEIPIHLELSAAHGPAVYVNHTLGVSSRLVTLLANRADKIPKFIKAILSLPGKKDTHGSVQLASSLGAIWANENVLHGSTHATISLELVLDTLDQSSKSSPWLNIRGIAALRTLAGVEPELFSRQQRERLMQLLHQQRRSLKKPEKVPVSTWILVIGLMAKVARKPNFYSGMHFNDLLDLASTIPIDRVGALEVMGLYQLLKDLSKDTAQQMINHYEEWGQKYFAGAAEAVIAGDFAPALETPLVAAPLCALVEVSATSAYFGAPDATFRPHQVVTQLARHLGDTLNSLRLQDLNQPLAVSHLLCQLEASACMPPEVVTYHVQKSAKELEDLSLAVIASGNSVGWKLRAFLMRNLAQQLAEPRPTTFPGFSDLNAGNGSAAIGTGLLTACVASAVHHLDAPSKLAYMRDLTKNLDNPSACATAQLIAIRCVVKSLTDHSQVGEATCQVSLATVHSGLTQSLAKTTEASQLCQILEILHLLTDHMSGSLTQWNVESALGSISALCSGSAGVGTGMTPALFTALCSLTSVAIRRHRLRLDDHHHTLLTTLEALLRTLISNATQPTHSLRTKHAVLYSRLITSVTEPSVAAVSRAQYAGTLDSVTDATKRIAGRHVYLLLLQFVKLQLEMDVSREMREALEPAMFSILDVTPADVRRILNDAMDASGRAILRDTFKRYVQFGRWSGV